MEKELLQVKENGIYTTSRIVAEKFGKEHSKVIRSIESLMPQIDRANFGSISNTEYLANIAEKKPTGSLVFFYPKEYEDTYGRSQKEYYISRDGFTLLVMGFTGKEALEWKLKFITAFNFMENKIRSGGLIQDNRIEIARMILAAPDNKVQSIRDLYPEYFSHTPDPSSLEYLTDLNTVYLRWKDDIGVDKDWIGLLPTNEVYFNYLRYCKDVSAPSMGKKQFYKTLEIDFGVIKKQRSNGYRYFLSA